MLRRATDLPEHFFAPVSTASRHAPGRHNAQQAVQACAGRGISAALALRASSAAGQALTALAAYQWASGLLTFPAGLLRSVLFASRRSKNPTTPAAISAWVRRLDNRAIGAVIDRPAHRNNETGSGDNQTGAGLSTHYFGGGRRTLPSS
jgi:hypothetical protein